MTYTIATYGMAVIGVLAFVVSLITEMIKNIGPLKNVPTDVVVIVVSLLITVAAYFGIIAYFAHPFVFYELFAAIVASFIVAYVAMNGWDKVHDIWNRFKK